MADDEIIMILQEHKAHLRECKKTDEDNSVYWIGALDCLDNLADKFGVEIE